MFNYKTRGTSRKPLDTEGLWAFHMGDVLLATKLIPSVELVCASGEELKKDIHVTACRENTCIQGKSEHISMQPFLVKIQVQFVNICSFGYNWYILGCDSKCEFMC